MNSFREDLELAQQDGTKVMPKNYGLQIVEQTEDNWVFGSTLSIGSLKGQQLLQPDGQWLDYIPDGERQFNEYYETNSCVSFALTNANEILNRRIYGRIDNYSDRFLAVASETTPTGNDPHKVCETLRLKGVCNEPEYPFTPDLISRELFFSPIPTNVFGLALRFNSEFEFNHEYVNTNPASLKEALKYSPVCVATFAWVKDESGLYYTPQGYRQNHYVTIVGYEEGKFWWIYDSYDLEQQGEFLKKVRWDNPFIMAKRIARSRKVVNENAWQKFLNFLLSIFSPVETPMPPLPKEILPDNEIPPEVVMEPIKEPHKSKISTWALAIQHEEGGKPQDLNIRLHNPGNLKFTQYTQSLGAFLGPAGSDGGSFCQFKTYDAGFKALCQFLTDAANDKLIPYHDPKYRTLKMFTQRYANPPAAHKYAENVAKALNVPVTINIRELL